MVDVLKWISNAADAQRHLTPELIDGAVQALTQALEMGGKDIHVPDIGSCSLGAQRSGWEQWLIDHPAPNSVPPEPATSLPVIGANSLSCAWRRSLATPSRRAPKQNRKEW